MSAPHSTTYARATLEYDRDHERALMEAVTAAIFEASKVSDADAIIIRTAEAAAALVTVLAGVLALSPAVVRSPTAVRKVVDDIGKRLRRQIAEAERNEDVQEFARSIFRGTDTEGNA
jgi:hypothetical protein